MIVSTCKRNLRSIVRKSLELGDTVILSTIIPEGKLPIERSLFWSEIVGEAITDVNRFIHSLEREGVMIIDTGSLLTDEKGIIKSEYSQDFLQLNEAGYRVLNQELSKILLRLLEQDR